MSRLTYHFPPFRLQVDHLLLWRGHEPVQIRPKALRLLQHLLEHSGEILSTEQLLGEVWGTSAQRDVVNTTISELRGCLGDSHQQLIKTLGKLGYRMDVDLRVEVAAPPAAPGAVPVMPALLSPAWSTGPAPLGPFLPDWYIPRPREERDALQRLRGPGTPAVLVGPERIGKSWLLQAVLRRAVQKHPTLRVIHVNLRALDPAVFASSAALCHTLAMELCTAADVAESQLATLWAGTAGPLQKLSLVVERLVLAPATAGVLLALDHADHADRADLAGRAATGPPMLSAQVLGVLRTWSQRSHDPGSPWSGLRLLMGVSTGVSSLISNIHQSPLNLSDPIELGDLDDAQAQIMTQRHGLTDRGEDLAPLCALVGGHPYLLHSLCYAAQLAGMTRIAEVLHPALVQRALSAHLDRYQQQLRRTPSARPDLGRSLLDVLRAALQPNSEPLVPEDEARLLCAGLLRVQGAGRYLLRYGLYGALLGGAGSHALK